MSSKHFFWIILAGSHAGFFVYQLMHADPYLGDSYEYLDAARNFVEYGSFYSGDLSETIDPRLYTKRPPLYPLFLIATGAFTGFFAVALLVQNLLSLLNIHLVLRLFRRIEPRPRRQWVALPLVLLFPSQLVYANMIMSEILFQTILVAAFYALSLFVMEWRSRPLLIYNLLLAAAALTKPVMYLFVLPNLVWMGILAWRRRDMRSVIFALLPLVIIVGYSAWNAHQTGMPHFSSIQSASLLDYNTRYFLTHMDGPEAADSLIAQAHQRADDADSFAERQRILHEEAWGVIRPRLPSYILFHLRGTVGFFLDPGRFDLYNFFDLESESNGLLYYFSSGGLNGVWRYLQTQPPLLVALLLLIALANVVKLLGLIISAFARVHWEITWSLLLIVGYVAVATGPVGAARFAVPVFPLLILAVLLALHRICGHMAKSRQQSQPTSI